jgi:multiple sugar transport system permease protein
MQRTKMVQGMRPAPVIKLVQELRQKLDFVYRQAVKNKVAYAFVAPFVVLFFTFTVFPVIYAIFYSFTYFNLLEKPVFVGLANYSKLFLNDDVFIIAVKNTLIFAAITGPIGYIASFLFAWLLNEMGRRLRTLLVVILYMPTLSGSMMVIWRLIFSGDKYGYANSILMQLGIIEHPINWTRDANYIMIVLIIVAIWMSIGTAFLAFIAGLQGIDRSLYEAGQMDGIRNRWQELWYITLPTMKPQLMFGAIMSITGSFAVSDMAIAIAGFPSVEYAGHTVVTHLMDYGTIRYDMGYASAIATVLFIVMVWTNKFVQKMLRKVGS